MDPVVCSQYALNFLKCFFQSLDSDIVNYYKALVIK